MRRSPLAQEEVLSPDSVIAFARDQLAPLLSRAFPGRFFLAGGAFKTLLHGRSPHDLDLWPATLQDRQALLLHLETLGAVLLDDNHPFQTTFHLSGRRLEVAYDCTPATLEERLSRFDLGLSAIGVEYAGGHWRGHVHPLAAESVQRREVLLLRPLANWKYLLATLERLRRYGDELGYRVPVQEEQYLWDLFALQPRESQEALMTRHARVAREGGSVLADARLRLRP
ncbi:hypothetical protein D7X30_38080 [Corallococcus sp. AB011P]|uniref:hypothetical protein n=1 Tax=unclassified Corallococcus TaxID=2685029 RepID=UPI000EA364E2|nr:MULTISPECIES: hypothetical protein [unclassified Corallococcus]RKG50262.1 hypothetical protein D7X30_38080 [Corallococcus sp. AB011P]RKH90809.1 hypothetical protein D7Y21_05355 [Corallococcus sp. AB045]